MTSGRTSLGTLLSAMLLSALTLTVFALLQDYGPESALRKFHSAVLNRDLEELNRVVTPGSYDQNLQFVAWWIHAYNRVGATYQLENMHRSDRRVIAEVSYARPPRKDVWFWVVDKVPGGWKVNVNDTVAQRQMYPLPFGMR